MSLVAIINYGMCNLDSVVRAVEACGHSARMVERPRELTNASKIILPGVGSFWDGMDELEKRGFPDSLKREALECGVPFLGICLGMQLLASHGTEGGHRAGLSFIPGEVVRFEFDDPTLRVPHIGWNEVVQVKNNPLLENVQDGSDFYFVHSFHFTCREEYVLSRTFYGSEFVSMVGRDNIFGTQFHPEKSLHNGLKVLKSFLDLC